MSAKWMRRGIATLCFGVALPASAGSLTYTYDDAGRLTQAAGTPGSRAYQLDPAGNRTGLSLSLQVGLGDVASPSLMASADSLPNNGAPTTSPAIESDTEPSSSQP